MAGQEKADFRSIETFSLLSSGRKSRAHFARMELGMQICCKPEEMGRIVRDKEEKEIDLGVSAVRVKICE